MNRGFERALLLLGVSLPETRPRPAGNDWISESIRMRALRCLVVVPVFVLGLWLAYSWMAKPWVPRERSQEPIFYGPLTVTAWVIAAGRGLQGWNRWRRCASQVVIQRVRSWEDPVGLAAAAERELRRPRYWGRPGWYVTDQFLIRSTYLHFDVLRLCDLLLAYRISAFHVQLDLLLWPFQLGRLLFPGWHRVVLVCKGGTVRILTSKKMAEAIVRFAIDRAPWAFHGSSTKLHSRFESDEAAFVAAVDQRRELGLFGDATGV